MSTVSLSSAASTDSSLLSSLGSASSGSTSIAADLQAYTKAQSSGDTTTADAAIVQLKSDLATERASLLSTLMGSADSTDNLLQPGSTGDIGDTLLATVASLSSNGADLASSLGTSATSTSTQSGTNTSLSVYA